MTLLVVKHLTLISRSVKLQNKVIKDTDSHIFSCEKAKVIFCQRLMPTI